MNFTLFEGSLSLYLTPPRLWFAGVVHEELLQAVADHFCKGWIPTMDRCSLGLPAEEVTSKPTSQAQGQLPPPNWLFFCI